MSLSQGQSPAISSHLEALIAKHTAISQKIDEEMKHAAASDMMLRQLKKKKLQIKEEIEALKQAS
jgi:hypothetical protein